MTDLIVPQNGNGDAVQPPQPTYPATNFNITPDGMVISTTLAPGLTITQGVGAQLMHEICKKWREVERVQADTAQLVQHVLQTKAR